MGPLKASATSLFNLASEYASPHDLMRKQAE
jgi:hypothetical protein